MNDQLYATSFKMQQQDSLNVTPFQTLAADAQGQPAPNPRP
jgi:hypothetical protein